ncbi:tetratricopeptide repeat protein [Streptomyces sp. NPDC058674]|uniref:tetratricopeptide repeat protein n=1 Tax=Streptomyces sp. NPDC058674 TaxID=3346592 RepID=UPI00364DB6D7
MWRTPGGRIPLLRHLDGPEQAGVRPAEGPGGTPGYVERDADALLRAALAGPRPRFALVVGEAAAGATRLAYEVVRSRHPRHAFVRPLSRAALSEAVRLAARSRRAVLWLDGLQDYLGAGGLTTAHLDGLGEAVVVVATMRAAEYRRHQAREASRLTGSDRGSWRAQDELLRRAAVVPLARHWSPAERRRAAARKDARLAAALEAAGEYGVAEVLAGVVRLRTRWTHARPPAETSPGAAVPDSAPRGGDVPGATPRGGEVSDGRAWSGELPGGRAGSGDPPGGGVPGRYAPGGEPGRGRRRGGAGDAAAGPYGTVPGPADERARGGAVVAAAVDCRRAGLRRPVDHALLRALHQPYLAGGGGGGGLRPEGLERAFTRALAWACEEAAAAGGLLAGSPDRGYTAAGCLLDLPGLPPVPDHLWRGLLAHVEPGDAYDLGIVARQEGRPVRAVQALTRALRGGVTAAELPLALAVGDAGRPRRAAADLAALARRSERRLGPRHPDTLAVRHQLAFFTGESGHPWAAAVRFAALVADSAAVLGPRHPDTLDARHQLAYFTGEAGDPRSAARQLASLLDAARPVLGADHPRVLAVRRGLLWYGAAEPDVAERDVTALLVDTQRRLGPADPHTLAVRAVRAASAARAGRTAEAVRAWEALAADRARVLGAEHPHTLYTRLEWAQALIAAGRPPAALPLLDLALEQAAPFLEPGHRHLRRLHELRARVTAAGPAPP